MRTLLRDSLPAAAASPPESATMTSPGSSPHDTPSHEVGRDVVVQLAGITKSFGTHEVLHSVDLTVHAGEHVVIFGPSGSGKSTLLRTINLLEAPDSGSVRVLGVEYGPGGAAGERRGGPWSCDGASAWSSSSSTSFRT